MRGVIGGVLVMVAAATASAARDYATASSEWNGLSELASIAAGRGLTIEEHDEIAWSDLGRNDVLFIVYPTTRVEPSHLAAFLRQGGRALLADDFGRADEALARLGVLRRAYTATRGPRHEGNPNLPIARPVAGEDHPLARGVGQLVTNHPSSFRVAAGPDVVFSYGGGEAVVVAGQVGTGAGRFVALSDPSVLINAMLAFDGNVAFAVNLLDYLAPARPGRIVLMTHDGVIAGAPPAVGDDDRSALTTNELLAELSRFLDELNDYFAPAELLRIMAVGLGGATLVIGLVMVLRRTRDPDASFARLGTAGWPAGLARLMAELDDDRRDHSYAYPAAILRENVEVELEERAAGGGRDRAYAERALALVRRLPPRGQILAPDVYLARRVFTEAHDAVVAARRAR